MAPVVAGLLIIAGLSMVAGWATVFRNRYYLGLLGFAFLALAGALLAAQKVSAAKEFGATAPGAAAVARVLLPVAAVFFLAAVVAAVHEVRRRIAEMREDYRAAEEALLAITQASAEKEKAASGDQAASDETDQQ
jgi:hypothetical protein